MTNAEIDEMTRDFEKSLKLSSTDYISLVSQGYTVFLLAEIAKRLPEPKE
jgi:hypothetical protein